MLCCVWRSCGSSMVLCWRASPPPRQLTLVRSGPGMITLETITNCPTHQPEALTPRHLGALCCLIAACGVPEMSDACLFQLTGSDFPTWSAWWVADKLSHLCVFLALPAAMVKQHSPDGTMKAFQRACVDDPEGSEAKAYR